MTAKHPGLSFLEVNKKMTEVWNTLDEEGKKKYEEIAAKDRERYNKEAAALGIVKKSSKEGKEKKAAKS